MKKDNFIKQAARWVARNIITPPIATIATARMVLSSSHLNRFHNRATSHLGRMAIKGGR